VEINASEFKAKCLALLDRVRAEGITVVIRKRGKIVAKLVAETDSRDEKPWLDLRGQSHFTGDPFAPAIGEDEIDALRS
jgi:antitoxin (DNA-binding transcriptional repressor) of toxin-antitoxin stability system